MRLLGPSRRRSIDLIQPKVMQAASQPRPHSHRPDAATHCIIKAAAAAAVARTQLTDVILLLTAPLGRCLTG